MLRSPKDDSRRPTTYAELQNVSKHHHQHDQQPSSPRQTQNQQHSQLADQPSQPGEPQLLQSGAVAAATTSTAVDGPNDGAHPNDPKAAGSEGRGSAGSSGHEAERLSGTASGRVSPYGRPSTGRFPGSSLMLPETICERSSLESRTPTVANSNPLRQSQTQAQGQQQQLPPQTPPPQPAATPGTTPQRLPKTVAKRGLFSGLFACFGIGASAAAQDEAQPAASPAPAAVAQASVAPPPAQIAPSAPEAPAVAARAASLVQQPAAAAPLPQTPTAAAPTSAVAAVAAALSMSPTAAAAHVQADSKLLLLLRAELGPDSAAEPPAAAATPSAPAAATAAGEAVTAGRTEEEPAKREEQPQQQHTPLGVKARSDGSSPSTPRTSNGAAAAPADLDGGRPSATRPPAATVFVPTQLPWPSKSPVLPGSGHRLAPGMMPASPDNGPADATIVVTRSPVGHLRHEDGDSVLRGSVDVHPTSAAASCISYSPAGVPLSAVARSQQHLGGVASRACSAAPRAPRQPLQSAFDVAATPFPPAVADCAGKGSSRAFLEPPESGCREREPLAPPAAPSSRPQLAPLAVQGLDLSLRAHLLHGASAADAGGGAAAAAPPAIPALHLAGIGAATSGAPGGGTPPRSSRKRSRATNACGGGALSQLDARKLAAMPLEEMLEQIQAAIAAEDLATGRTARVVTSSGGGLSDGDCSILPMPPVVAKARSGTLRRRKSGAGGSGRTAGHHSGGGGNGGPSRGGGRSTDGGTRGGASGVGAVQTTLMKAAAATAAALGVGGGGGRRRRVRSNRSPPLSARRKPPQIVPPTPVFNAGQPVSPTARKSDGASSYGQPVWRHGGRAMAFNGLGLGGIPTTVSATSPRSAGYDSCFARQPPYKKPQLCTPTAAVAPPPAASGFTVASVLYGGNGGLAGISPPRLRQPGVGSPPRMRQLGVSPPRLRQSAPVAHFTTAVAAAPPQPAVSKTPMPAKTPGVAHTQVRAARRILDVDGDSGGGATAAAAPRQMGYAAALLAASTASKATTPVAAQTAKKAAPPAAAAGPITSSLNISDLLTRFGHPVVKPATRASSPAKTAAAQAARLPGSQSRQQSSPPPQQRRNNRTGGRDLAGRWGGADGGANIAVDGAADASSAAAFVVVPSFNVAALRAAEEQRLEVALAHGSPAPQPTQQQPDVAGSRSGSISSSGDSTPHKPRMAAVTLTELLLRASSVPERRRSGSDSGSGGGSDNSHRAAGAEADGEEPSPQPLPDFRPVIGDEAVLPEPEFTGADTAGADAEAAEAKGTVAAAEAPVAADTSAVLGADDALSQPALLASQNAPESELMQPRISASVVGRLSSTTGGAGIPDVSLPRHHHHHSEPREASAAGADPGRASVGYLDLLQAYSQAGAGRASATLPHYAMPIASRATSAGGGGAGIGSGGGATPARAEGVAPDSPARTSPARRQSVGPGCMRTSSPSVGSYAQLAALRSSGTVAAAAMAAVGKAPAATAGPAAPEAPYEPVAVNSIAVADAEADASNGCALPDAASTSGSPTHGSAEAAQVASPSTSSVVAQLPHGDKAPEAEGLASTAAVRGGGVPVLEDTADSGDAATGDDEGESLARGELPSRNSGDHRRASVAARPKEEAVEEEAVPAAVQAPGFVTARSSGELLEARGSVPQARQQQRVVAGAGGEEALLADNGAVAADDGSLRRRSSGSQPQPALATARSSLAEVVVPAAVSPLHVGLPLTPRPSATPFADWRCVPLDAYEASLKEYDTYLAAPTADDE